MRGNEFCLWAKKVNRNIMSRRLNRGRADAWPTVIGWEIQGKTPRFLFLFSFISLWINAERLHMYLPRVPGILLAGGTRGMRGGCAMSESDWLGPGARAGCLWPRGPVGGFGALGWVDVCHAHVMPALPDEPCSYPINTIIAGKCIYLICETETVLLDLWCKARFN